jgi:glycopeptide antibiotics resistance protein
LTNYFLQMPTKTLLAHKNFWLSVALLWTLLIGILCLVSFKKLPTVKLADADKYVHATFHLFFTLLWFAYFRLTSRKALLKAFLSSLLYGIAIEIMQSVFTETRQADIKDVAANAFGAILAVLTILLVQKYSKRPLN